MSGAPVQLDLFGEVTTAFPTQQSATGVIERTARRLGYDWVACCVHCRDVVILVGEWRPVGWVHRRTGDRFCDPAAARAR